MRSVSALLLSSFAAVALAEQTLRGAAPLDRVTVVVPAKQAFAGIVNRSSRRLFEATNMYRVGQNLPPVELSTDLMASANVSAAAMASTNRLDHNINGTTPAQRAKAAGYAGDKVTENYQKVTCNLDEACVDDIAKYFTTDAESKANLDDPDARFMGIATSQAADGSVVVVEHLGA